MMQPSIEDADSPRFDFKTRLFGAYVMVLVLGAVLAAMVYHYATADTVDHSVRVHGRKPANQDWLPVLRDGHSPDPATGR